MMQKERWEQIESILDTALTLAGDERTTYVEQACGDDQKLLEEVYAILEAAEESERTRFLENFVSESDQLIKDLSKSSADDDWIGTRIGPFSITGQLGSGGMGAVYKAKRVDGQFQQEVAIKLLQKGIQSKETLRRFRQEQEILATLKHSNIAQLYDGGITDDGLPYLIMEYVDGVAIDQYCNDHKLTIDQRIELFTDVCKAVQFAHANLVIHRDLKAQNIFVNSEGTVKVLDFGIAKLLDPKLTEQTLLITRPGQKFWTPQYAAPEQVKGEGITTATDVYALGVLLHKLLTDTYPLDLKDKTVAEAEQMIAEGAPKSPSLSIAESEEPHKLAATRQTKAADLRKKLTGDIDAMVSKALRKEPEYRYNSVAQLIEELERCQNGLPLLARKDTISYRVGKFYRRHKTGVAITVMVILFITGITGFYTWRIAQERDLAQAETAKAEEVMEMMVGLFEANNPSNAQGETMSVREVLEEGTSRIQDELNDQPEVKAALLAAISRVHENLGFYEDAISLQEQALTLRRNTPSVAGADLAESLDNLGVLHARQGSFDSAEPLYREALAIKLDEYDSQHPEIANSYNNLGLLMRDKGNYEAADSLFRASLAIKRQHYDEDHSSIAKTLNNLATLLARQGDLESAQTFFEEVLSLRRNIYGNNHPLTANSLNNLSVAYAMQGNFEASAPLIREAVAIRRNVLGEEHPLVVQSMGNLASMLRDLGDYEAAKPIYEEALSLSRKNFGADHPTTMKSQSGLANLLAEQENYQKAESLLQDVVSVRRERLGDEHPLLAQSLYELASVQYRAGGYESAARLSQEALQIQQVTLPEGHRRIALTQSLLGACLTDQQRYTEAEPLLDKSYASLSAQRGPQDKDTRQALQRLVNLYEAWEKPEKAALYRVEAAADSSNSN